MWFTTPDYIDLFDFSVACKVRSLFIYVYIFGRVGTYKDTSRNIIEKYYNGRAIYLDYLGAIYSL